MAKMKGAIVVDTERCKGCQLCIIACPQKVIALANKVNLHGYPYVEAVNEEACVGCASCGIVCQALPRPGHKRYLCYISSFELPYSAFTR